MNIKTNQTMTLSSTGSLSHLQDAKLSNFIGYSVGTQTLSSSTRPVAARAKPAVVNSLERSLKENADVWAELSKL